MAIVSTLLITVALIAGIVVYGQPEPEYTPMVAAGYGHTVGLKADGTVVAVGDNHYGQCDIGGWTGIIQVAAGSHYTVGLRADGTVVAIGWNFQGQCNVGGWKDIIQVAAGVYHTVGLKSDGTVVAVGANAYGQCNVGGWTDIIQVAASYDHTVGLETDGSVVAVGYDSCGQCNVGNWTGITQVAAGGYHTVGLKSDGTVVAVGDNSEGQCNVGTSTGITRVAAGSFHTVGLEYDGTVVAVGNNGAGQCDVGGWTGIVQVAAGTYHTVGLKSGGTVVAVGLNDEGPCGNIVTETVTNGTVDATEEADTRVVVTGTATVTVFPYDDNPGGSAPTGFNALGKWVDVYVPDTAEVTEIQIRLYYDDFELAFTDIDEELLELLWWDGDEWKECSDSGVNTATTNGYSGYMWAKIRNNTTPSLADLQGTEFGGYAHPSQTPGGGCFIATAAYGTDTAREIDILREFRDAVLLPNSLGARFVSFYYKTSPPIANFISQHEVLITAVRVGFVDPIVKILNWTHNLWSARGS